MSTFPDAQRDIVTNVKAAGIVGAGGAGFPTHVKLSAQADVVIANGAECEPLLRVDQQVMSAYAEDVIDGLRRAMKATGAKNGVIALKDHYREAIDALSRIAAKMDDISLFIMKSYYPAGDEQQIVFRVTGRVVPTGGIPLDVGVVISNVSTLVGVARAQRGIPVTEKYVTVGGAVRHPVTLNVPIGTSFERLIDGAGGVTEECGYIVGGPCMGKLCTDMKETVTKTTGGLLALPKDHPLFRLKGPEMNLQMIKAVCCQCTMCSQMCPRNALGLRVEPHKAMRSLAHGADLIGEVNGVFSCCDCGVCTYYACNFGLKPAAVMAELKRKLMSAGVKPDKTVYGPVDEALDYKCLPTSRLTARLGLSKYDVPADMTPTPLDVSVVNIPLKMNIGAPSVPSVKRGDKVSRGDLIATIPKGALGATIHASIDGEITAVTNSAIAIERSPKNERRDHV
jgi:Na+-translocating ferredoxin:NAD+ oxidoreductase RnfC subunit